MKFSTAVLFTTLASASAFVPQTATSTRLTTRQFVVTDPVASTAAKTEEKEDEVKAPQIEVDAKEVVQKEVVKEPAVKTTSPAAVAPVNAGEQIEPGRYDILEKSIALPFLQRPPHLDGSHAGDYGFDPLGLSDDVFSLYYMQECELRHARLAMLAVVGWPISEMIAPDFMLQNGCAPSVLNGFNIVSGLTVLVALAGFGAFEYFTSLRRTAGTRLGDIHRNDMKLVWDNGVAGDYNFDPANLYNSLGNDAWGRKAMRNVELTQGRLAMIGITAMAVQEAFTGKPVIESSSLFFQPNAILPLAAIAYFAWNYFYEVSDLAEYPIRVQYNKDGEQRMRDLRRTFGLEDNN